MHAHRRDHNACKTSTFVIGVIFAIILTGLLIYLCLYLTKYRSASDTITIQSNSTNHTTQMVGVTTKNVQMATIAVNDKEIAEAAATIANINKIAAKTDSTAPSAIDSITDTSSDDDTTLVKAPITTFTRVTLPSPPKPIKQITILPEKIELTDITPTI